MVREQSKIRHFLRFGNSRSSTSDPLSQEPSRGSARDISSVTGTLSSTHEPLPRLGCLFHWTGAYQSGPTIPRATDGSAGRVAQEEGERSEVVSTQIIPKAIKRPGSELVPAAFGRGVDTILKPFDGKDTAVESAVRIVGGDIVDSPMRALVGSQGDAAQQALDCMTPISCVGEMAVDVERGHSTTANIRAISDTNLQTLRIFNSVVITITNVHPYTQIALGMLTSASQTTRCPAFSLLSRVSTNSLRKRILSRTSIACERRWE
ncbi:hypothetical protein BKA82DRAFT_3122966 [Pisolithus tinctorius]|nr:hypothetical protein BKA82DRAFT_3122966 [Pisolithus tinctorius]